jgi:hypothetical protein
MGSRRIVRGGERRSGRGAEGGVEGGIGGVGGIGGEERPVFLACIDGATERRLRVLGFAGGLAAEHSAGNPIHQKIQKSLERHESRSEELNPLGGRMML